MKIAPAFIILLFAFLYSQPTMAKNVLDSVCYDACANSCNRHLRSKNRRNCRNSCSHKCTRLVKNVKKISKDAEKAARSVRDAGGKIIDTVENLWNALNDSGDYPSRLSAPKNTIDSPDINFKIASSYLNEILHNLAKSPISTNDKSDNNYIQLSNPRISFDSNLNIIVFESGGVIAGDFGKIRGALKAKALRVDLAPTIRTSNDNHYIDIFGKITYIDIKDSPPKLDKYVANAAHHVITQDKALLSIDITNYIQVNQNIDIMDEKRKIAFNVVSTSITAEGSTLSVKVKIKPRAGIVVEGEEQ